MKLTYGEYEIEIKAKVKGAKRNSTEATCDVIHDLITHIMDASYYADVKGYSVAAERKKEKWMELFDQLKLTGYYDFKE